MTATNETRAAEPGAATTDEPRRGGLDAWAPSVTPPVPDLTDEQALACAFRILAHGGFSENMAGHITWQRPGDEHMLVNPWGLWWDEITASDLCVVDADAAIVSGKWDVTPAIHIHTELHRRRPDARVVIHNHPYWVTVMAAVGMLPEILHQNGSMFHGDLGYVEEYTGEVDSADLGADLATMIGDASVVILASHGVIVTGETLELAVYRAATIERMCKLAFDVHLMGKDPLEISPTFMTGMRASQLERAVQPFWDGAVRLLLRREPDVLD
jgi:ribulose-5-phosphate 4-epimerase/fuculose-1-phosphate aldolase